MTTPEDRVRIFDADGFPLVEFRARVQRSWVIGDEGRASFFYPSRKTEIVNERALQFGNWLLIENSILPPWVGVIDTPRKWSNRNVDVYAYTPERVFSWRRGPLEEKITGSAGTIFERLLTFVNRRDATILNAGNIWRGGPQREETVNPTPLSEDLRRLQERSLEEYSWRPIVNQNGRLVVFADWSSFIGRDTGILLHEGVGGGNIESKDNILVEDGPIVNDILAYGEGETWQSKPISITRDEDSATRYSLRQTSKLYDGVENVGTLSENGQSYITQHRNPLRSFRLNALNVGETFQNINIGNIFDLSFEKIGFYSGAQGLKTKVRIMGMAYDPLEANLIQLVTEEVYG